MSITYPRQAEHTESMTRGSWLHPFIRVHAEHTSGFGLFVESPLIYPRPSGAYTIEALDKARHAHLSASTRNICQRIKFGSERGPSIRAYAEHIKPVCYVTQECAIYPRHTENT